MVEHDGSTLLVDPWIVGSCYWRSWWNFPEPDKSLIDHLDPDAIYLTHLHWDHFHSVSLRRFDRSVTIYVPRVPTRRMVDDLAWLGFTKVHEIDHTGHVRLGPDFVLHSFQFGLGVDSAAIVTGGGVTLFNCNDCKYFGLPLQQIKRRFPKIDFVFRSHSSARAIPYCIDGYKKRFADYRTRDDYSDEFAWFAIGVGARYAIPFASNHCFLHPDTLEYNDTAVTPEAVAARCDQLAELAGAATRSVVMPPGSFWDERAGFSIEPFDYATKSSYVEKLRDKHGETIAAQLRLEAETVARFADFAAYFKRLSRSLFWPLARILAIVVVFRVRDKVGTHCWLVDLGRRRVA
ncbi:MAG: MBL fold metallo-hydrolase, partial [Alphaproteobacteria bacterium]|nr:MBL fold metallo-hydrolase [Alphaproteobacteria bacterium]